MLLEDEIEDQKSTLKKTKTENEQLVVIFSKCLISKDYSLVIKFSVVEAKRNHHMWMTRKIF